jgi:uncharacterized zinc-type alcohol dehydrogenase-like protein
MTVRAYAAHEAGGRLEPFEYELGTLKPDEVEIDVEYCGICHSDLSMLKNEWRFSRYPFVPGHEVVGRVAEVGNMVNHLKVGQYVGLGWRARSCLECDQCLSGYHNRCLKGEDVIIGRHGGYAEYDVKGYGPFLYPRILISKRLVHYFVVVLRFSIQLFSTTSDQLIM